MKVRSSAAAREPASAASHAAIAKGSAPSEISKSPEPSGAPDSASQSGAEPAQSADPASIAGAEPEVSGATSPAANLRAPSDSLIWTRFAKIVSL